MQYWIAVGTERDTKRIVRLYLRGYTETEVGKVFSLFRRVYAHFELGSLIRVRRLKGWLAFRRIPHTHECVWEEYMGTSMIQRLSTSRSHLILDVVLKA